MGHRQAAGGIGSLARPNCRGFEKDYWLPGQGWRWIEFGNNLPQSALYRTAAYQVYPNTGVRDQLFWGGTQMGNFSIQSVINLLCGLTSTPEQGKWQTIWKVKAPQKMKVLLWLIYHDALMSNEKRVKRELATDPNCASCDNTTENIEHILRSCNVVRSVWDYFERSGQGLHNPHMGVQEWVHRNITMTGGDSHWPTKFTIIVWWLWRWCNERAELRAMLRGLTIAREKGYKKLVVLLDSTTMVGLLQGTMTNNARHSTLIQQCRRLLELSNWEVVLTHCFRESNKVADAMANMGIGL
ncbi:LOW QUALITY PROTEIN: hypothetical protein Cgig2_012902 [Carnegiea gigantea]|uniref:Uncharacterized protein n=1 Tax=Carnegiea gigantea TaxID=171969 RepID=A0A9Q1K6X2_9CARY|nr:LOW QUALITY PROTEIN: hypothetical protein Cgig2_012902 [Carnegiea gigantea]